MDGVLTNLNVLFVDCLAVTIRVFQLCIYLKLLWLRMWLFSTFFTIIFLLRGCNLCCIQCRVSKMPFSIDWAAVPIGYTQQPIGTAVNTYLELIWLRMWLASTFLHNYIIVSSQRYAINSNCQNAFVFLPSQIVFLSCNAVVDAVSTVVLYFPFGNPREAAHLLNVVLQNLCI